MKAFSCIIPWRNSDPLREHTFTEMLRRLRHQDYKDYEIIIIEHSTSNEQKENYAKTISLFPPDLNVFTYKQLICDSLFNKSWCMNVGAKLAKHPHLLFLDADSLFERDYLKIVSKRIDDIIPEWNKLMIGWEHLDRMPGRDEPTLRTVTPIMIVTLGGTWYCLKDFYFNDLGGMNENFVGYGGEDNEAHVRACHALKVNNPATVPYKLVHPYHHNTTPTNTSKLWLETRKDPQTVINRLKESNLGNIEHPTFIRMDDLQGRHL